jgi:hypothetical protein
MTASFQSVEDICNAALDIIGYDRRIGDMYEGTRASKVALDLYAQTRDELLRKQKPGFASRSVQLTLQKSAPVGGYGAASWNPATNPPPPWQYQYAYPTDCLEFLYCQPTPATIPVLNPLSLRFRIYNDQVSVPPARVILATQTPLIGVYVGQVTDMTTWDSLFVKTVVSSLAKKFAMALVKNQQLIEGAFKIASAEEAAAQAEASVSEEN